MRVNVDEAGRLVIPLALRRLMGLRDGGEVDLEATSDGILLRRPTARATVEVASDGLPVVHMQGVERISNDDVLDAIRADRLQR